MLKNNIIFKEFSEMFLVALTMLRVLGVFGALFNVYVILCLLTTHKYIIVIPNLELSGNICLAVAIIIEVLLLLYLFRFRSFLLSLIVNATLISTGLFVIKSFAENSDDNGLITQNRIYSVYYNYTIDQKLAWLPKLENQFGRSLTKFYTDNLLEKMHCYNDLKRHVERSIAEEALKEHSNSPIGANLTSWIWDHKTAIFCVLVTVGVIGYIYYNGFLFSGIIQSAKDTGKAVEKNGQELTALSNTVATVNQQINQVILEAKETVIDINELTNNLTEVDQKVFYVTDQLKQLHSFIANLVQRVSKIETMATPNINTETMTNTTSISADMQVLLAKVDASISFSETMTNTLNDKIAVLEHNNGILKNTLENLDSALRRVFTEHSIRLDRLENVNTTQQLLDTAMELAKKTDSLL